MRIFAKNEASIKVHNEDGGEIEIHPEISKVLYRLASDNIELQDTVDILREELERAEGDLAFIRKSLN